MKWEIKFGLLHMARWVVNNFVNFGGFGMIEMVYNMNKLANKKCVKYLFVVSYVLMVILVYKYF